MQKVQSLEGRWQFCFLNERHGITCAEDWNNPSFDKLWLYNLHYFDTLSAPLKDASSSTYEALIEKWIGENPPGAGNGWEPYPVSLRLVNWIKWALYTGSLSDRALHSMAVQARFLAKRLEYHLLGNHLLANAKALVFAGLFFEGGEAGGWLEKGSRILEGQIPVQVLPDGGHFELSPMYHAIILEDLLDLINMVQASGVKTGRIKQLERLCRERIPGMLSWLSAMCHPDGGISFFNDAALGIAPGIFDLTSYSERLGIFRTARQETGSRVLKSSGYVRLENRRAVLLADTGRIGPDYLPGHAHADTLSFELSVDGQRVLVNSGISCYGISDERSFQRGTAAHNTVTVDDTNSSDVWGGFRVAQRAFPMDLEVDLQAAGGRIRCGHDGYARQNLKDKPIHRRQWHLDHHSLEIVDKVSGKNSGVNAYYHLHPCARVDLKKQNIVMDGLGIGFDTDAAVTLEDSQYHPGFGMSVPNLCLVLKPSQGSCRIKFDF